MKRVLGRILAGLSFMGGAAIAFPACVHDDSSLFILDALAQPSNSTSSVCGYTADPTQPYVTSGVIDYVLTQGYLATFLVGNQLVPEVNNTQLMTETSFIDVQGAVVRITKSNGDPIKSFTRLAATTIPPSTGATPGFGAVQVVILDPDTVVNDSDVISTIQPSPIPGGSVVRFVTYTKIFGKTLGGKDVESNEFEFPVDVCAGCLVNFTDGPDHPTPNCVVGTSTSTTTTAIPCQPGQDVPVPCSIACPSIPVCMANDM
jgi:hypothetical protein